MLALVFGQAAHQNGNEDDVVDAQDDFQGRQGAEGDPGLGVGKPFHGRSFL
jgi:hypothetical protein